MGTTGSTPAPASTERKGQGSAKTSRKAAPPPTSAKHQSSSSPSPALKKGPKNYVDMGIEEEESEAQLEQGKQVGWLGWRPRMTLKSSSLGGILGLAGWWLSLHVFWCWFLHVLNLLCSGLLW